MPLLIDYYTIHEMDEGRIGFAPHNNSSKPKLQSARQPLSLLDGTVRLEEIENIQGTNESAGTLAWVGSIIILLFLYAVGIWGLFPWLKSSFLPDDLHNNVKYGRYVLICTYLVLVTYFSLSIMRLAIINAVNGSAS